MKAGKVSFKVILYSFADSDYASMYSVATVYIIFDANLGNSYLVELRILP